MWAKKRIYHPEIYEIEGKMNLAIYKPHRKKILFLHMQKGTENPVTTQVDQSLCFFAILIKNLPALIEKSPKILNP